MYQPPSTLQNSLKGQPPGTHFCLNLTWKALFTGAGRSCLDHAGYLLWTSWNYLIKKPYMRCKTRSLVWSQRLTVTAGMWLDVTGNQYRKDLELWAPEGDGKLRGSRSRWHRVPRVMCQFLWCGPCGCTTSRLGTDKLWSSTQSSTQVVPGVFAELSALSRKNFYVSWFLNLCTFILNYFSATSWQGKLESRQLLQHAPIQVSYHSQLPPGHCPWMLQLIASSHLCLHVSPNSPQLPWNLLFCICSLPGLRPLKPPSLSFICF